MAKIISLTQGGAALGFEKPGDYLFGTFVGRRELISSEFGPFHVWEFDRETPAEGKIAVSMVETTALVRYGLTLAVGSAYLIVYRGMKDSGAATKSKPRQYAAYDLYLIEPDESGDAPDAADLNKLGCKHVVPVKIKE